MVMTEDCFHSEKPQRFLGGCLQHGVIYISADQELVIGAGKCNLLCFPPLKPDASEEETRIKLLFHSSQQCVCICYLNHYHFIHCSKMEDGSEAFAQILIFVCVHC